MKLYKIYNTEIEALSAQSMLRAEGIESIITKDDAGGTIPSIGSTSGYRVLVKEDATDNTDRSEEILPRESMSTEPANKKWGFYGGLILGVIIGLLIWIAVFAYFYFDSRLKSFVRSKTGYSNTHQSKTDPYLYYKYENNKLVETLEDRNRDGKIDAWYYYIDDKSTKREYDDNFDGKVDHWVSKIGYDSIVSEFDVDSNGIPDLTASYKYSILCKVVFHPNGSKPLQEMNYKSGVLDYQIFSPDSSGKYHKIRNFDKFGNIISEKEIP